MSRSGYSEDFSDDSREYYCYRNAVQRALSGKRGQALLREMARALDAMPEKRLIADELITSDGEVCALGAVGVANGMDMSRIDYDDVTQVAEAFGIARSMAAEIEYMNDEANYTLETPEQRWVRMQLWVDDQIEEDSNGKIRVRENR